METMEAQRIDEMLDTVETVLRTLADEGMIEATYSSELDEALVAVEEARGELSDLDTMADEGDDAEELRGVIDNAASDLRTVLRELEYLS